MHVLCEGGFRLARTLAEEGLVDEWITVLAPKVIGNNSIKVAKTIPQVSVIKDFVEE
jgi:riboflavin biosynthesis pyrimidine reductase